ncbi:hypothetical protein, conserved [Trypanosoma brucei gambiense DAL972]|uniref:SP-RING-type domain-containing protein n=1 Tax=Trypanosoma brucei gambiense (strain MHOM/CI/86/DAL972) TaxID=679716 RepID=C9ZRF8_TRYB9|nr:hypothetical protein, conserved [Trypanosoma brucei gambiense DAL972]CBH11988.1 hypothetical protein, conserved [Trypanosoma brucei gambiense DAL972]|eukprot:XP_011774273.1 hypothetical protein, conserved [Trypanosoma brucei gambiense DAL972]
MPYPLGSSLWVKCDDGEWWPATVREVETELLLSMGSEYDTCIEFYHDPGNFYPLDSTSGGVRLLHLAVEERDKDEQRLFNVSATKEAVRRLLEERSGTPTASPTEDSQPYSAAEMRYMRSLVDSVSPDSAAVMQNSLKQEGVNISRRNIRRVARKERSSKSKVSRSRTSVEERSTVRLTSSLGSTQSSKSTNPTPPLSCGRSSSSWRRRSGGRGGVEVYGECVFQEAVDAATLDVLRAEVFGNPDRFVLSPLYRFLDVLGAVSIEGESIETTLPSPAAVNEEPPQGFSPSRRVLLVPLSSSSYNHTDGWLESFEFENKRIAMELFVNGLKVVTPPNPSVPSGRESVAVKTTPVADITEMVSGKELFSLRVHFTGLMEDATLWEGYIVAVYVERTGVDLLAERIVSNYHSSPAQREVEGVVDVQVRAVCPITALPLSVPVRACGCEHVQCIELQAVLMHCDRTNVWNCPLCWAPMTPETIAVNYRLKEWLDSNRSRVNKVDFIVETPPGRNLNVVWRKNEPRKIDNIETLE